MGHAFDRAYYRASIARNLQLADEAQMPHIREAHLHLAEFYAVALSAADAVSQADVSDTQVVSPVAVIASAA